MSHNHDHGHHHAPTRYGKAFVIGIVLNTAFVIIEALYGRLSNSLTLIADAGHNLSDVLGLFIAWMAVLLRKKSPTEKRTYGFRKSSIMAALFNAIFLLVAVGAIVLEAIQRLSSPAVVAGKTVILVAIIGIIINGLTALLFLSGRKGDLNIRGAFLHMIADAVVSLGAVIAGFIIIWTGWQWFDPVVSLIIAVVIMFGTWGLLRDSMNLSLDAVPQGINIAGIKKYLQALPSVVEVHDLHVWGMSTTEAALTVHLVRSETTDNDSLLQQAIKELHDQFEIEHATIQIEKGSFTCSLAPDEKV